MGKKSSSGGGGDYEIGHGKPPGHTRFKPGQSGNPGGRRKGSRNVRTALAEVLDREIEITDNGRKRKVSGLNALVLSQFHAALHGDFRALKDILDRIDHHSIAEDDDQDDDLPEDDAEILNRWQESARPSGDHSSTEGSSDEEGAPREQVRPGRRDVSGEGPEDG